MSAIISNCGTYRYTLRRTVGMWGTKCLFIMLNPSTADATEDDPTIRRCMGFAKKWECGELIVVNLFAYRATDPLHLATKAHDPVGPDNHQHVTDWLKRIWYTNPRGERGIIVCAWGKHGIYMDQDETVLGWIMGESISGDEIKPLCLGVNSDGTPKHPLYLPANSELIPYKGRPRR